MPRKRPTRLPPTKPNQNNKLPVAVGVSEKARKEQLQMFLKEYDSRVKNVLNDFERNKTTMRTFIVMRYEKRIADLPQEIKDMTLEDFSNCGGTIEAAMASVYRTDLGAKHKYLAQKFQCTEQALEDITEEDSDGSVLMSAKPSTTTRPKRQVGKTVPQSTNTSTRNKAMLRTPANSMKQSAWGATPLFTPKFDMNLPGTPENIRTIKPGERCMSMAGSPLQVEAIQLQIDALSKGDIAQDLSDVVGIDLTPTRIEQMVKILLSHQ
uniref:Borealin C-terminal domain-containing protein n=1 Tax=Arion vulgaris TaxID=1028688 RepID=A0A0B6ZKI1_9EUPU